MKRQTIRYVTGRRNRNEIGRATAASATYTLDTLAVVHGRRPVAAYGPATIDRWLETIADRAPSTRRNMVSQVRGFSRWLVTQQAIRRDPTAHIPRIRQPRRVPVTFTRTHIETLMATLPDQRARVIVAVMNGCGARCAEVAALHVEDYDPVGRVLVLRGKGGHERLVPVPPSVAHELDRHLESERHTTGPLLRSRTTPTAGLSAATVSHYVRNWMWQAGVKTRALDGRSAHGLRRTCASELMEGCGDIRVVQGVMGHAEISTTARFYLRAVPLQAMRDAMNDRDVPDAA